MRRTFWIARTDLPVVPVTYSRSRYFAFFLTAGSRLLPASPGGHAIPLTFRRRALRSRPTSTLSSLERSPMIFFIGGGRCRTSVGTATI